MTSIPPAHSSSDTTTARQRAFFDASGSQRITQAGQTAYRQALEDGWADPTRLHTESRRAASLLDGAREAIAGVFGVSTKDIHFAPSHVEALHRATSAILAGRRRIGSHVAVSAVERSAILNALTYAEAQTTVVPVDTAGRVLLPDFIDALRRADTAVAILQQANPEVGTVQPLTEAYEAAQTANVPLLVDAGASIGHIAVPHSWDALVAQPADWGGGQGIGVLAVRPRTRFRRTWPEDSSPWFPGVVNIPAAFAAAVTLLEAERERASWSSRSTDLITKIRSAAATIPDCEVVGDPLDRLPHVATFSCLYVDGEALVTECDRRGYAVGSGSACTSLSLQPSHVLAAMGVLTHGNVRIALDRSATQEQVERFCQELPDIVATVRRQLGVSDL
ncbi:cysteine desulfurase family protein [Jonesia quinghaiensis]|uniref:cysteine desulfurase family protein n=1 Tax=Jonesia quinghaiensis TaxID=262806 RepID=UPI00041F5D88|nr:aminotransferase class V-fold PLP-dependent enzyme [Jonesia quinghaiensis]